MADPKREGILTHFIDAVAPTPGMDGDWGGTKNGDTSFQGAEKGVAGKIPEVTMVSVNGAPGANSKATVTGIANKGSKG
jgi:hypothetical protein